MKTNVAISSVENYHQRIIPNKAAQELHVLSVMRLNTSYTGQQLSRLTGLVPGTISRVLGDLRESGAIVREAERQVCPISLVLVFTHRKVAKQLELV